MTEATATRERDPLFPEEKTRERKPSFEERKEPVFLKFETRGQVVQGHLAGIVQGKVKGKPGVYLFLFVGAGKPFMKILATRQMMEKLTSGDVGKLVRITYQGLSDIQTVGEPMKLFRVEVDSANEPRTDILMETSLQEDHG